MKFKYFILGCLFSVVVFICLGIFMVKNSHEYIYVKDLSGYGRIVTEIDQDIDKLKSEECKTSLHEMLNFINKTHYDTNVTIQEYYNNYYQDKTFIDHFYAVQDSCKLDDIDSIYVLALSSTNFPEVVKSRYNLRHEFTFKDSISRQDLVREQDNVGTYTNKVLELRVIKELIDEAKS